jgi:hypothetical protein
MGKEKGGIKLRRSPKHKGMYAGQVFRTAKNKAAAKTRIARRKLNNPQERGKHKERLAYHRKRRAHRRDLPGNWDRRKMEDEI